MIEVLLKFVAGFPAELGTMLLAMTPIGELRLALPVALFSYDLPLWEAFFWSVFGNLIPPTVILLFAKKFHDWVDKKAGFFGRAWVKYLHRAQKKFEGKYRKYGLVALFLFVAIPLPMTGAFTGSAAAFVFGIPFRKSWPFIFLGVVTAGIIVSILSLGIDKVF